MSTWLTVSSDRDLPLIPYHAYPCKTCWRKVFSDLAGMATTVLWNGTVTILFLTSSHLGQQRRFNAFVFLTGSIGVPSEWWCPGSRTKKLSSSKASELNFAVFHNIKVRTASSGWPDNVRDQTAPLSVCSANKFDCGGTERARVRITDASSSVNDSRCVGQLLKDGQFPQGQQ